jgi:Uma2 family endonuclease
MALPQVKLPAFSGEDYLVWEAQQPERSEYVRGEVFAMAGGEDRHMSVAGNLFAALRTELRGSPCRVYMSEVKLRVEAADVYVYPDVFVTCSPADRADRLVKREAVLVAEVLSESTEAYDRGDKFAAYRLLPSLREVLFIDLRRRTVDLFRLGDDGLWVLHPLQSGDALPLRSVGVTLAVDVLFDDLEGEAPPAGAGAGAGAGVGAGAGLVAGAGAGAGASSGTGDAGTGGTPGTAGDAGDSALHGVSAAAGHLPAAASTGTGVVTAR